jgi:transcriptional regulator with XRE-family HTH domain
MKVEYKTVEMAEIDYRLILHVKELREGKFTQDELCAAMGLAGSFIGKVESFLQHQKYGTRHLTLLAKAFKFKSIAELFKFPTPEHDRIKITLKISPKLKKDGTPSKEKLIEVVKIEPV